MKGPDLAALLRDVRACRLCLDAPLEKPALPHEPRPVLQLGAHAPILLAGQAPGARVHASGRPFTDPSGERLRAWLGLNEGQFYDPSLLAIVPMGFCFPGQDGKGGDLPPRRACAATWHGRLFASRPAFDLTLVIGRYARDYHLPHARGQSLTMTIQAQAQTPAQIATMPVIVLPHPSWRNTAWLKRHPWFEAVLLPRIKARVQAVLEQARKA